MARSVHTLSYEIIDANTFFGAFPRRRVDISKEKLSATIRKHGVKCALTLSTKGIFYDYVQGNAETLKVCASEDTLMPVATIDPRKYCGELGEVAAIAKAGFKLFRLFPDFQSWPMEYAPFLKFLQELNEVKRPLMMAANAYGIATRISQLTCGLSFPVILTSIGYWTLSEAILIMRENRNIYVETHLLDSTDAMEVLAKEIGASRLIFGSNSPFMYFSTAFLPIKHASISEDEKKLILGENILRIIGD